MYTLTRLRNRRARRPRGYAMTMFLIILVVITAVTAALASTVTSSIESSREAAARAEARMLAASTIEAAYANITANPEQFNLFLKGDTAHTFSTPGWVKLPGQIGQPQFQYFVTDPGTAPNGTDASSCTTVTGAPDYTRDCVELSIEKLVDPASPTTIRTVLLTASTRVDCNGAPEQCVYADYQQRLRRAQFYDYLFFNDSASLDAETLGELGNGFSASSPCPSKTLGSMAASDPCRTAVPAFTSRDSIDGAVYMRDDFVPVCGNPDFKKDVHIAGRGYREPSTGNVSMWAPMEKWRADTGCATTGNIAKAVPAPLTLRFPTASDLGLNVDPCSNPSGLPVGSVLREAANATPQALECITPASSGGTVTLTFNPGVATVSGATRNNPLPYDGKLLYITGGGDVAVEGAVKGNVTVITGGSARIIGNLTYDTVGNGLDAFSLVASGRIVITQPTSAEIANASDARIVRGVLVSLNKSIVVENWSVRNAPTSATLDFQGSLAGKYRSAFGGYDDVTGTQVSGFSKKFAWDSRFSASDSFLKYLPRPKATGWVRLDLTEVATRN